jgi:DNA-binding NarL/FixJ family response regulator
LKLLIASDRLTFRIALRYVIEDRVPGTITVEAASLAALKSALPGSELDLVLLDLQVRGTFGLSALVHLRAERPELPVVLVSADASPCMVERARQFGAAGFVAKAALHAEIDQALGAVRAGGCWFPSAKGGPNDAAAALALRRNRLTVQQLRVLSRLSDGMPNKQIASEFSLSENTVKIHVSAILAKLGCSSRTQAVLLVNNSASDGADLPPGLAAAGHG